MRSLRVARATGGGDPSRWSEPALLTAAAIALAASMSGLVSPSVGADPPGEPGWRIPRAEAELGTTPAPTATRGIPPNDATAGPDVTASSIPGANAALKRARAEAERTGAGEVEARLALDRAISDQAAALTVEVAAQEALLAARVRLGGLIAAEDEARATVTRAAARVQSVPAGSKHHRSAFIEWQMAAVAERAAHARRTIAQEVGARLFVALETVEVSLAKAEIALGEAQGAHRNAERAATAASDRVTSLEAATSAGPHRDAPTPPGPGTPVPRGSTVRAEP